MEDELVQVRKDSKVFQGVKKHLNELLKLRPNYEYVMIAAQGSQNYNLDLYTNEYKSDIDTIAIVMPSFDSFVNNEKYISETLILDNNEHMDIKDVRLIFELFMKQNIKYLEILFTKYRIINHRYKDIVLKLLNNTSIAQSDPKKLMTCTYGMQQEKIKALEHPYEGLKDKIEKYGYDGKQLHHIIRLFAFAKEYMNGYDFEKSINSRYYTYAINMELEKAKLNKYSLDEARMLSKRYSDLLSEIRSIVDRRNIETCIEYNEKFLNDIKTELFTEYFKNMFTPKEKVKKKRGLVLPQEDSIWVTSDLHFGHENMLGFEPKRFEMLGTTEAEAITEVMLDKGLTKEEIFNIPDDLWDEYKKEAHHNYIEKHDEELIRRWNNKVRKNDVVFILGDLSFRNGKETNEIVKRLNGRKILVKGNHENICMDRYFDTSLFEEIVDYKEISVNNQKYVLSHYPIRVWNQKHKGAIHLFGHIHSNTTTSHPMKEDIEYSYNVGVDVNDYEPRSLKVYKITADYYKKLDEIRKNT